MSRGTILVVDDEWAILELFRIKLEGRGYRVMTASNTRECRERIAERVPDLLILDIWLGEENGGTHLHDALIREGLDADIPVIFVSSLVGEGASPQRVRPGGKVALYGKPFDFDWMGMDIDYLIEGRKNRDARATLLARRQPVRPAIRTGAL